MKKPHPHEVAANIKSVNNKSGIANKTHGPQFAARFLYTQVYPPSTGRATPVT